jgi:hypothetical protein
MTAAKKYDVEGPIGLQLNKKRYSKMLQQMDAAMQKAFNKKEHLRLRRKKKIPAKSTSVNKLEKVNKMLNKTKWLAAE